MKKKLFIALCGLTLAGCSLDTPDLCPDDPRKTEPGICGCGISDKDKDGDTIPDCVDTLPNLKNDADTDGDTIVNIDDPCPQDAANQCCPEDSKVKDKAAPGFCGCDVEETDSDDDTLPDCVDICKNDKNKVLIEESGKIYAVTVKNGAIDGKVEASNDCGCGNTEEDTDEDGVKDCHDVCPNDPMKFNESNKGICACGVAETDTDEDGVKDCNDVCPDDPLKSTDSNKGVCECGVAETDTDGDTVKDCNDVCPTDDKKSVAADLAICGCEEDESLDSDNDTVPDCADACKDNELIQTQDQRDATTCGCDKECEPCPEGALHETKGVCGCYIEAITSGDERNTEDTDDDGIIDCYDICPNNHLIKDSLEGISNISEYQNSTAYKKIAARCEYQSADNDDALDDQDACPTNRKESSDNTKCDVYNESKDTFNVRHVLDLDTLKSVIDERKAKNITRTLNVNILDDINLAYDWVLSGSTPHKTRITYTADSCIVKSPALDLENVKFAGKNNVRAITAQIGDKRCSLDGALINSLTNGEISNLQIDFDVSGSGRALLLTTLNRDTTLSNIEVKGTIRTDVTTTSTTGVGGLVAEINSEQGEAKYVIINNCYGNGVNIYAPKADNVGGLIGYKGYSELTIETKHIAGHIEGNENVGGMLGFAAGSAAYANPIYPPASGMIINNADEVIGLKSVGGYAGTTKASVPTDHIINTVNKVEGKGGANIGGLIGYIAAPKSTLKYIDNKVTTITSKGDAVGGLVGFIQCNNSEIDSIKNNVTTVSGNSIVGGMIGELIPESQKPDEITDDGKAWYKSIQNTVTKVESKNGISGCMTARHGNDKTKGLAMNCISSACNLTTLKDTSVSGLIGVLPTADTYDHNLSAGRVFSASTKLVNGTAVYRPLLYPTIKNYTIPHANAFTNMYYYSRGKTGEYPLNNTSEIVGSGDAVTSSNLASTITALNNGINTSLYNVKFEQKSFEFTDESKSYNIPVIAHKDPLMNQR